MFTRRFVAGAAVLTWLAAASSAQAQGTRFGTPDMMALIQHEKIQAEVEVKDFQAEEIKKLAEQMDKDFPPPNLQSYFQLSPEEQTKARVEMQAQSEKSVAEAREKLGQILLPPQMKRLDEIFVQAQGVGALRHAFVIQELALTENQVKQIAVILQKGDLAKMKMFREVRGEGRLKPEHMERLGKIRAKAASLAERMLETQVMDQLKDEQKKTLEELRGKPFELPPFSPPGGEREAGDGNKAG